METSGRFLLRHKVYKISWEQVVDYHYVTGFMNFHGNPSSNEYLFQIQAPASGAAGIPHPEPEDAVPTGHRHVRTATAGDGAIVAAPRRAARASEVCSADEEEGGEASAMGVDGSEPSLKRACRSAFRLPRDPWQSCPLSSLLSLLL
jgi:hypothetical protein